MKKGLVLNLKINLANFMNDKSRLIDSKDVEYKSLYIIVAYKTEKLALSLAEEIRSLNNDLINEVIVVINSDKKEEEKLIKKEEKILIIYSGENLGYFGGARKALEQTDRSIYECIILLNSDIIINGVSGFKNLKKACILARQNKVGIIAPRIIKKSKEYIIKNDQNPQHIKRLTAFEFYIRFILFSSKILTVIYRKLKKTYQKNLVIKNEKEIQPREYIYAPNGSCLIFTRNYIDKEKEEFLRYGEFLFNEEIDISEKCMNKDLKVSWDQSITLIHNAHITTGSTYFKSRKIYQYFKNSFKYIYKTYYRKKREIILSLPANYINEGASRLILGYSKQINNPSHICEVKSNLFNELNEENLPKVFISKNELLLSLILSWIGSKVKPIVVLNTESSLPKSIFIKLLSHKLIYIMHRHLIESSPWGKNTLKTNIIISLEILFCRFIFDNIIVNSKYSANIISSRYGIDKKKLKIIPPKIRFNKKELEDIHSERITTYKINILRIGCIARDTHAKGIDQLFQYLNQIHSRLLEENISLKFELVTKIRNQSTMDWITKTKTKWIKKDKESELKVTSELTSLSDYLGSLDLYLQPSRTETFCLSLAEAISTGIPTIYSDIEVFKELYGSFTNGLKTNWDFFKDTDYEFIKMNCCTKTDYSSDTYDYLIHGQEINSFIKELI